MKWLPIPGYPDYEVSDSGRVRRPAPARNGRRQTGRYLRAARNRVSRYLYVSLTNESGKKSFTVHRLVALAFHGPPPHGRVVAHFDGNRANNRAENLRWATPSENSADMMRHRTNRPPRGPRRAEAAARAMGLVADGWGIRAAARAVGIDHHVILRFQKNNLPPSVMIGNTSVKDQ